MASKKELSGGYSNEGLSQLSDLSDEVQRCTESWRKRYYRVRLSSVWREYSITPQVATNIENAGMSKQDRAKVAAYLREKGRCVVTRVLEY